MKDSSFIYWKAWGTSLPFLNFSVMSVRGDWQATPGQGGSVSAHMWKCFQHHKAFHTGKEVGLGGTLK